MKKIVPAVLSLVALPVMAETLTIQGVGGTMDAHGRSPILTVYTEEGSEAVTISADAYVKHSKYVKYPIRYQFFVNRELISTQFSSPELPGSAKVTIDEKTATVPFNYTVIADLVYPNRTFSSVIQGAIERKSVKSNYNCNLTLVDGEGDSTTYSAESASATASTSSNFALSFDGVSKDDPEEKAVFEGSFSVVDETLSGSAQIVNESEMQKVELSGNATSEGGVLQSFNVVAADGSVTLNCE